MENTEEQSINYPRHVALIVDGNRRWAKARGLPTLEGHRKGIDALEKILDSAKRFGISCITAWVFSTENWSRSKEEVKYLFQLFKKFAGKYKKKCIENKIKFVHLGRKDRIDPETLSIIRDLEESTKNFTEFTFALALDYGGHDELIRTINKIKTKGIEVNAENIEANLDTASLPPVDLIIRTSGEQRLSGFLSWQSAYSEFYFAKVPFPGFTPDEFEKALKDYLNRERRFGGDSKNKNVPDQQKS